MASQRSYSKRKRSAKEKRKLLFGLILVLIFTLSILAAIYYVVVVGVG